MSKEGAEVESQDALMARLPVSTSTSSDRTYTQEDRLKAACAWLAWADQEESREKCAKYAGIPVELFTDWQVQEWWPAAIQLARYKQGEKLDARLSDVINKATFHLLDRLENGDEQMDRDGEIHRVAVAAKDLMVIAALASDKRQILRGQPTAISRQQSQQLQGIADALKQRGMALEQAQPVAITQEGNVVDVKPT